MMKSDYQPIYEFTRGDTVESIHYGAIAVVDATGKLIASYGYPQAITYLRSSAKPFQALPFLEHGGPGRLVPGHESCGVQVQLARPTLLPDGLALLMQDLSENHGQ